MQDKSVTATLCDFASEVNTQALPGEVVDRAALLVTDSIGVAIRARKEAESTPALLAAVARMGMDAGRGTVFADDKGYATSCLYLPIIFLLELKPLFKD